MTQLMIWRVTVVAKHDLVELGAVSSLADSANIPLVSPCRRNYTIWLVCWVSLIWDIREDVYEDVHENLALSFAYFILRLFWLAVISCLLLFFFVASA